MRLERMPKKCKQSERKRQGTVQNLIDEAANWGMLQTQQAKTLSNATVRQNQLSELLSSLAAVTI